MTKDPTFEALLDAYQERGKRVVELEQEVEAERKNYCMAFRRAEIAEDKLADQSIRIKHLEQLCRDMYGCAIGCTYRKSHRDNFEAKYANRMQDLGLLEGGEASTTARVNREKNSVVKPTSVPKPQTPNRWAKPLGKVTPSNDAQIATPPTDSKTKAGATPSNASVMEGEQQ